MKKRTGELAPNSKVSNQTRVEMCLQYKSEVPISEIARIFNVSNAIADFTVRHWGPENGFPYKKLKPKKDYLPTKRSRKPKLDLTGFENDYSVVLGLANMPGHHVVQCKVCGNKHEQENRGIKNNALSRLCPNFRIHNKSSEKSRKDVVLRHTYGIDTSQYEAMLSTQEHQCAICTWKHSEFEPLVIDHDHRTGAVRALLCRSCNHLLGLFNDRADLLRRAKQYLEKTSIPEVIEPLQIRLESFTRRYRMPLDCYQELYVKQKGCCAICQRDQKEVDKPLRGDSAVDSNEQIALLCQSCDDLLNKCFFRKKSLLLCAKDYLSP